ncbi:ABC transporter ATP-binding protein [Bradyrhizobium sp. CCBAU 45384]|uniref:ABC transporter ATP-binding protein n=2 Tax=unclassified Bradyrhizobium TaxID=2631580 RepID=UPI002306CB8C|nr:ATP-binding cassette domain-containing protein [Bradyrhizobium sp. CCBAU 45384]MDA9405652.1 ABC transporter ATP-binding protein [Bradyrhizobium sp. CCBAU 45384]MDA9437919.1 ABC transporter ATP-binding protein [Bradyrhizobium sp. CCBAU 51745]
MTDMQEPALECRSVSVTFGPVTALSQVSLRFEAGRVHAVVGQNGAGKTTFARVVAGLIRPQSGEVLVQGRPVAAGSVKGARAAGVELVHQSFALPPSFTICEAMEFGAKGNRSAFTRRQLERRWNGHLASLDISVDRRRRIRDLPVETQQGVEIARALVTDARVLILDEPTAVLSPSGAEKLFDRIRTLNARGVTVILILHKIREVLAIADTVTVLRGGKLIAATMPVGETDAAQLAEKIIGSASSQMLSPDDAKALVGAESGGGEPGHAAVVAAPMLELRNVATRGDNEGPALRDVSLVIRPGEIVGVAGVEGNGQRTLVRAIAALVEVTQGEIKLDGAAVTGVALGDRRNRGLRIIPFERNTEGLSLSSALWENWSARQLLRSPLFQFINPHRIRRDSEAAFKAWEVRYASTGQRAGSLSGGNAQKVILAREIDDEARLILAAQPTRGLDIGATAFVWRSLRAARDRGCAVLLVSSDLDELFDISDRIVVMLSGAVAGEFSAPYDIARVGATMTEARP